MYLPVRKYEDDKGYSTEAYAFLAEGKVFALVYDPRSPNKRKRIKVVSSAGEFDPKSVSSDLAVVKLAEKVPQKQIMRTASGECDDRSRIVAGFGIDERGREGSSPGTDLISNLVRMAIE